MAIALAIKNKTFNEMDNTIEFSVVDVAAAIGWNSGVVKHQLKNLEWIQGSLLYKYISKIYLLIYFACVLSSN